MTQQQLRTDAANAMLIPDNFNNNQVRSVVVKAYVRVVGFWKLTNPIACKMISVSPRTWARMKNGTWDGTLKPDQVMRLSAIIGLYKGLHLYFDNNIADLWVTLHNEGPMFSGRRPIDVMVDGGLPMIMETRNYVDALRGGM